MKARNGLYEIQIPESYSKENQLEAVENLSFCTYSLGRNIDQTISRKL